ncbi:hypothetical protein GF339_04530, partial [candidate division KSB3 bacterium]|nr:hypothetical protein [candidate division KSB3 bacterium]MBD3323825.1 hypothetical protein [candidate division KSB3 bacterium]
MTGKEFKEETTRIRELRSYDHFDQAHSLTLLLIKKLFQRQKFSRIVELFHSELCEPREQFYTFEVAYALSETECLDESEVIYEHLLTYETNNVAVLNNLSHIKSAKNQLYEAFELIRRAYEIGPQDEIIAGNYRRLLDIIQKQEAIQNFYLNALDLLANEDDGVTERLQGFLRNLMQEQDFVNHQIAIPDWKFSVLMDTDRRQAEALCKDWLAKGYLRYTGKRDRKLVPIYELNPF